MSEQLSNRNILVGTGAALTLLAATACTNSEQAANTTVTETLSPTTIIQTVLETGVDPINSEAMTIAITPTAEQTSSDTIADSEKEESAIYEYLNSDERNQPIDEKVFPIINFVANSLVNGALGETRAYYDKDAIELGVTSYTGWGILETTPQDEDGTKPYARVDIYFNDGIPDTEQIGAHLSISSDNRENEVLFTKDTVNSETIVPFWRVYNSDAALGVNSSTNLIDVDSSMSSSTGTRNGVPLQYIHNLEELKKFDSSTFISLDKTMATVFPDTYPVK